MSDNINSYPQKDVSRGRARAHTSLSHRADESEFYTVIQDHKRNAHYEI